MDIYKFIHKLSTNYPQVYTQMMISIWRKLKCVCDLLNAKNIIIKKFQNIKFLINIILLIKKLITIGLF